MTWFHLLKSDSETGNELCDWPLPYSIYDLFADSSAADFALLSLLLFFKTDLTQSVNSRLRTRTHTLASLQIYIQRSGSLSTYFSYQHQRYHRVAWQQFVIRL